ncbi:TOMM precursor leader peptide-binding protein [Luteipulveratus mongoliensis]|uniref:TOMM precursor leader peptide-binding protein n=1 Tax=Luteipulveratus mongoliensis TaxID=571913 RepID=UPI0012ED3674|nr:TOMM precursor leader peptide-binding protein [Luteipulveratus mongoliensis]
MLKRPRIRGHYRVEATDGERVFLLAESDQFVLEGQVMVALIPLLDGTRAVEDLVSALSDRFDIMRVFGALQRLYAAGHLTEGRPDLPLETMQWLDALAIPAAAYDVGVRTFQVVVTAVGDVDPGPMTAGLSELGLKVRAVPSDEVAEAQADFVLVLADDYLNDALAGLNAAFLQAEQPWGLAKPGGRELWAGPFFAPGETGCWRCLQQRLAANRQVERYVLGKRSGQTPHLPASAHHVAGDAVVTGLLAAPLSRMIATRDRCELTGRMRSIDLGTGAALDHELIRQPQCPECGDVTRASTPEVKITLTRGDATNTTDGGYRMFTPQQTYDRLEKHISPAIGAITGLTGLDVDAEDGITYSYAAGHNFAMVRDNVDTLKRNMRSQSGGKGRTSIQAKVSAVCEALERYSAVWRGDERVRQASYDDLSSDVAIHPDRLTMYSDAQYDERDTWNDDEMHRLHLVPERFRTDLPIDWAKVWSLTDQREREVPAAYLWYGHPDLREHFFCISDSNGSASGNTLEEAILQGFCEIVERDAVAIWWYNRTPVRGVDLSSIDDPYIATMQGYYASMDRSIWVLDLTSDLGIPTFAACSARDHEVEDIMVGFGAHPDANIAVMRALTELNQFLPVVRRRDEDGNTVYLGDDPEMIGWARTVRLGENRWLQADPSIPLARIDSFPQMQSYDLVDCIEHCVEAARQSGLDVVVADLSRPEIELSVVKVIVPGMRHFWRRTGPGRLYDVPVRLGRLDAPTSEHDLNPRNVFF